MELKIRCMVANNYSAPNSKLDTLLPMSWASFRYIGTAIYIHNAWSDITGVN